MITTIRIGLGEVRSNYGTSNGKPALILEPINPSGPVGHRAPGKNNDPLTDGAVVLEIHAPEGVAVLLDDLNMALQKAGMVIPSDIFRGFGPQMDPHSPPEGQSDTVSR